MTADEATRHRNNFDALRLLFASLVLASHAAELIDGDRRREVLSRLTGGTLSFGEFAVNGFFALSGYLIVASWVRRPDLIAYARNRILRIYPGFIVAFAISVLVVGSLGAVSAADYLAAIAPWPFFWSMITLHEPHLVASFVGQPHPVVNGALWTIAYEFRCYVAVAAVGSIVGLVAARALRTVWVALSAALIVASCLTPELFGPVGRETYAVFHTIRLSAIFFAGGSLYLLNFRGTARPLPLAVMVLVFAASLASPRFVTAGFAIVGSLLILSVGLRTRKWSVIRDWPDISYGTYLYGWPIQKLLHWYLPTMGPALLFVTSLVLALGRGWLSWTFVERPFMQRKVRSRPREPDVAERPAIDLS